MHEPHFEIRCDASPNGQLHVKNHALSVAVSQVINTNNERESWQSVLIICEEGSDGLLTTKIIVCHPQWDQNLQIACIKSRSAGPQFPQGTFEIDLKAIHV
jgi:hypothetical protein